MKFFYGLALVLVVASVDAHPQKLRDRLFGGGRPGGSSSRPDHSSPAVVDDENPLFPAFTATRATEASQNGPQQTIK